MIDLRDHYWLLSDGRIWSSAKAAFVPEDDTAYQAWLALGNAPTPSPDETYLREGILRFYGLPLGELAGPEELSAAFTAAINVRLNAFAALRQYDDITSARLAALSADFAEDGHTAQVAYDTTWTAAIAIWEQVTSGDLTVEQALEHLPALTWPGGI
ncbi:MAG: hypothetical protein LBJ14_04595 [Desulfarculales bacterium]|jgi:hypothetical protein|nr:hypothetical protein [Desulfarculales bacterium]